jgi:hypothetical protein
MVKENHDFLAKVIIVEEMLMGMAREIKKRKVSNSWELPPCRLARITSVIIKDRCRC